MKTNNIANIFSNQSISNETNEIVELQNKVSEWNKKAKIIQSSFDFIIPSYILDEIIEKGGSIKQNHQNLDCLLNCAVINNRISKSNSTLIKKIYS